MPAQVSTSMYGTTDTRFCTLASLNTVAMKAPTQVPSTASAGVPLPACASSARLTSPAMAYTMRLAGNLFNAAVVHSLVPRAAGRFNSM
jgi:hypothetical protein